MEKEDGFIGRNKGTFFKKIYRFEKDQFLKKVQKSRHANSLKLQDDISLHRIGGDRGQRGVSDGYARPKICGL
jgi:hypothetical protein